jgi:hypothetical protein
LKVAFSYYSSIISIVTPVRAQASLKDMQRQYGKARALGMFGYCVLWAPQAAASPLSIAAAAAFASDCIFSHFLSGMPAFAASSPSVDLSRFKCMVSGNFALCRSNRRGKIGYDTHHVTSA